MLTASIKKNKRILVQRTFLTLVCTISLLTFNSLASHATNARNPYGVEQVGVTVSYQTFYDELSPYGSWTEYPDAGYVWHPNLQGEFTPYGTFGHWVYTDYGWTWVSDYHWGWAPFHYGRWGYDDGIGWFWVPGYDWAPAWVSWGNCNGYYGWGALPWGVGLDIYVGGYRPPYNYWSFCRDGDFGRGDGRGYIYGRRGRDVYGDDFDHRVTIINNYYNGNDRGGARYAMGPRREDVESRTHTTIRPMTIANGNNADRESIRGNQVVMYRPTVASGSSAHAAPRAVAPIQSVRTQHAAAIGTPAHANEWSHINQTPQQVIHSAAPANREPAQHNTTPANRTPIQQQPQHNMTPANRTPVQQQPHNTPINRQPVQQQQQQQPHNMAPVQQQPHNTAPMNRQPVQPMQRPAAINRQPAQQMQRPASAPRQEAPREEHPR